MGGVILNISKGHYDKGLEYYTDAKRLYDEGRVDSGATLFILAAIKFNDFLCQKYLHLIPRAADHKQVLKREVQSLERLLGKDYKNYVAHFSYLLGKKSVTEYGVVGKLGKAEASALGKHCERMKAIVDRHLD